MKTGRWPSDCAQITYLSFGTKALKTFNRLQVNPVSYKRPLIEYFEENLKTEINILKAFLTLKDKPSLTLGKIQKGITC